MIINRDGNITLITQEKASVETLVTTIEKAYDDYKIMAFDCKFAKYQ